MIGAGSHESLDATANESTGGPAALDSDEREAWAILASVPGLGPATFGALVERLGTGCAVIDLARGRDGAASLARGIAASPAGAVRLLDGGLLERIVAAVGAGDTLLARLHELDLAVLIVDDEAYPARLRAIEMPPPVLFVRGDTSSLSLADAVAVVGTRRPSDDGRRVAARIAAALGRLGVGVVSGLAVGIDGAAHAAVVGEGGRTVAVLAGGHGRIYPRAHTRLAEAIVAHGGAIVTEMAPDSEPMPGTFPRRNRLISGLADATVVVEAAARSGALITAGWALEQGRECFLVPGRIDAPASSGCLAFLREFAGQARIVVGIPELLEDLGVVGRAGATAAVATAAAPTASAPASAGGILAELGATERLIALVLLDGRTTVDELVVATELPVATVLGTLTLLEMRGLAIGAYGRYRPSGRLASEEPPSSARRPGVRRSPDRGADRPFAAPAARVLP